MLGRNCVRETVLIFISEPSHTIFIKWERCYNKGDVFVCVLVYWIAQLVEHKTTTCHLAIVGQVASDEFSDSGLTCVMTQYVLTSPTSKSRQILRLISVASEKLRKNIMCLFLIIKKFSLFCSNQYPFHTWKCKFEQNIYFDKVPFIRNAHRALLLHYNYAHIIVRAIMYNIHNKWVMVVQRRCLCIQYWLS